MYLRDNELEFGRETLGVQFESESPKVLLRLLQALLEPEVKLLNGEVRVVLAALLSQEIGNLEHLS